MLEIDWYWGGPQTSTMRNNCHIYCSYSLALSKLTVWTLPAANRCALWAETVVSSHLGCEPWRMWRFYGHRPASHAACLTEDLLLTTPKQGMIQITWFVMTCTTSSVTALREIICARASSGRKVAWPDDVTLLRGPIQTRVLKMPQHGYSTRSCPNFSLIT